MNEAQFKAYLNGLLDSMKSQGLDSREAIDLRLLITNATGRLPLASVETALRLKASDVLPAMPPALIGNVSFPATTTAPSDASGGSSDDGFDGSGIVESVNDFLVGDVKPGGPFDTLRNAVVGPIEEGSVLDTIGFDADVSQGSLESKKEREDAAGGAANLRLIEGAFQQSMTVPKLREAVRIYGGILNNGDLSDTEKQAQIRDASGLEQLGPTVNDARRFAGQSELEEPDPNATGADGGGGTGAGFGADRLGFDDRGNLIETANGKYYSNGIESAITNPAMRASIEQAIANSKTSTGGGGDSGAVRARDQFAADEARALAEMGFDFTGGQNDLNREARAAESAANLTATAERLEFDVRNANRNYALTLEQLSIDKDRLALAEVQGRRSDAIAMTGIVTQAEQANNAIKVQLQGMKNQAEQVNATLTQNAQFFQSTQEFTAAQNAADRALQLTIATDQMLAKNIDQQIVIAGQIADFTRDPGDIVAGIAALEQFGSIGNALTAGANFLTEESLQPLSRAFNAQDSARTQEEVLRTRQEELALITKDALSTTLGVGDVTGNTPQVGTDFSGLEGSLENTDPNALFNQFMAEQGDLQHANEGVPEWLQDLLDLEASGNTDADPGADPSAAGGESRTVNGQVFNFSGTTPQALDDVAGQSPEELALRESEANAFAQATTTGQGDLTGVQGIADQGGGDLVDKYEDLPDFIKQSIGFKDGGTTKEDVLVVGEGGEPELVFNNKDDGSITVVPFSKLQKAAEGGTFFGDGVERERKAGTFNDAPFMPTVIDDPVMESVYQILKSQGMDVRQALDEIRRLRAEGALPPFPRTQEEAFAQRSQAFAISQSGDIAAPAPPPTDSRVTAAPVAPQTQQTAPAPPPASPQPESTLVGEATPPSLTQLPSLFNPTTAGGDGLVDTTRAREHLADVGGKAVGKFNEALPGITTTKEGLARPVNVSAPGTDIAIQQTAAGLASSVAGVDKGLFGREIAKLQPKAVGSTRGGARRSR